MSLLSLKDFTLSFNENGRLLNAVKDISMEIGKSEMVALIGESGCGKSATALSLMGLGNESAICSGHIYFEGDDIIGYDEGRWNRIRGKHISMIFQEPSAALNPLLRVGSQIMEMLRMHQDLDRKDARKRVLEMLESVELADVERIYRSYPHQLSGGQKQRILDVTIQAEIIELIKRMNKEKGTAVLLISHNLSLVKGLTRRSYIMYSGTIVESGETEEILSSPIHPYTRGLIASIPDAGNRGKKLYSIPGAVPSLEERSGKGCPFASRCRICSAMCFSDSPRQREIQGHAYSCFFTPDEIEERMNG